MSTEDGKVSVELILKFFCGDAPYTSDELKTIDHFECGKCDDDRKKKEGIILYPCSADGKRMLLLPTVFLRRPEVRSSPWRLEEPNRISEIAFAELPASQ